jgi:hypothetical protein
MSTPALRHFVERALGVYAPVFEEGFPSCFDWERLLHHAPAMVEQTGGGSDDGADRSWAVAVQTYAEQVFRAAHVAALALLVAQAPDEATDEDPESVLDRFARPTEDDVEERFAELAERVLGPLEESLGGADTRLDESGAIAHDLFESIWPETEAVLVEVEAHAAGEEDLSSPETKSVLASLGRVAAILAVLRWMASLPPADAP